MPTYGTTRYDTYLTNLALSYPVGNFIADLICPRYSAAEYKDYVFMDADDAINLMLKDEAEGTPSGMMDYAIGTPYSYRTTRKALSTFIPQKEMANAAKVVKMEQRETQKLIHRLRLKHEIRVKDILTDNTIVTQTKDVDATANARWDESSPDLESDIITAVTTIQASTGCHANTIVIPFKAAMYAAKLTWIKNVYYALPYDYIKADFQGQAMRLVGLPPVLRGLNVVISDGRYNNANKGETASSSAIWGKDCLIGYVPPSLAVEDMFGVATMEYEPFKVSKEAKTDPTGVKILAEWDYSILQAKMECWYLLQNVIA